MPTVAQIIMNTSFRMFPDSGASKGKADAVPAAWERTIRWDDPQIGIDWPLLPGKEPIISTKDQQGTDFEATDLFLDPGIQDLPLTDSASCDVQGYALVLPEQWFILDVI